MNAQVKVGGLEGLSPEHAQLWAQKLLLGNQPACLTFATSWWMRNAPPQLVEDLEDMLADHGYLRPQAKAGSMFFLSAPALHAASHVVASGAGGSTSGSHSGKAPSTAVSGGATAAGGPGGSTGGGSIGGNAGGGGTGSASAQSGTASRPQIAAATGQTATCSNCASLHLEATHPPLAEGAACSFQPFTLAAEPCMRAQQTVRHPNCPNCSFETRVDVVMCCHHGTPGRLCVKLPGLTFSCQTANEQLFILKFDIVHIAVKTANLVPQAPKPFLWLSSGPGQGQPQDRILERAPLSMEKKYYDKFITWGGKLQPQASTEGGVAAGDVSVTQGREEAVHLQPGDMQLVTCRATTSPGSPCTSLVIERDPVNIYLAGSASATAHAASFDDVDAPILLRHPMVLPDASVTVDFHLTMEAWQPPAHGRLRQFFSGMPAKDQLLEKHAEIWALKRRAPSGGETHEIDMGHFSMKPL